MEVYHVMIGEFYTTIEILANVITDYLQKNKDKLEYKHDFCHYHCDKGLGGYRFC